MRDRKAKSKAKADTKTSYYNILVLFEIYSFMERGTATIQENIVVFRVSNPKGK